MSIRHAILGLLAEQPMHGYKLKTAFDGRVSPLWGLTTGQIYPSLAALERGGYLESRGERAGRRPARRIYSVTDAGRRELDAWLGATPHASVRPFREDVLIRLMLLRPPDAPALRESLARQERDATLLLARLTHARDRRRGDRATIDIPGIFSDGMAHHVEADIKHLQSCQEALEAWVDARPESSFTESLPGPAREPVPVAQRRDTPAPTRLLHGVAPPSRRRQRDSRAAIAL